MNHIDVTDPRPRGQPLPYTCVRLGGGTPRYLNIPHPVEHTCVWDVLEGRRSRRQFELVDSAKLGALLWYTSKTTSKSDGEIGVERRCIPSAGGLHPIHIVVQQPEGNEFPLFEYDPTGHALFAVAAAPRACDELRLQANTVVDVQAGTVLWLIANFSKAAAVYENAPSLVWRDAGVLIGALCIVAEALSVNACPLGICGDLWLRKAIALPDGVHGVGAVVLGGRARNDNSTDLALPSRNP